MATKYIIDNLAEQTISGSLSAITLSADTICVGGNPITQPYKVYTALLTQTGNTAPEAIVLENTLGVNISYSYWNTGVYYINSDENIFLETNFTLIQGAGNSSTLTSLWSYYNSPNQLYLECYDLGNVSGPGGLQLKNDILLNQFIEIRVYN